MSERKTKWLLGVTAVVLVALAVAVSLRTAMDEPKVMIGPGWENLTPEQREQKYDDAERKRRASGRGPGRRQLPEDNAQKKE